MKFTVNFKGKENPKAPGLVKLEMILFKTGYARVPKVISITGSAKEWDNETQQFKSKGTEAAETNKRLLEVKTSYLKVAEAWEEEGRDWSPVQWSHCFDVQKKRKEAIKVISITQMFDVLDEKLRSRERIKNGKIISSVGTAEQYKYLRRTLEDFTRKKYDRALSSFYFDDITEELIDDFVLYVQKRAIEMGNEGNLRNRLRLFRGVIYYATKMGIPGADLNVFERARPKMQPKTFVPKTLPKEVITKIENVDRALFSKTEQLHIDLFLFSYYTGGMASVDVSYLTWDCITPDGRLNYERTKFPKTANMVFLPKAKAIAEKYKDKCFDNYVMPVFSHKHNTEAKQRNRMRTLRNKVNETLRKLEKAVKYKDKITWYAARGTFISAMINKGEHPATVAGMSGNSAQTIFKHYFKPTNQKQVDSLVEQTI